MTETNPTPQSGSASEPRTSDAAGTGQAAAPPLPPSTSCRSRARCARRSPRWATRTRRPCSSPSSSPRRAARTPVVQARTGTGQDRRVRPADRRSHRPALAARTCRCSSLCPTRELALQVARELERLGKRTRRPASSPIYGGAPMERQVDALAGGRADRRRHARAACSITSAAARSTRSSVRMLVLDEADEMLSMGFERELNAILETLPKRAADAALLGDRRRPTSSASRSNQLRDARVHHALGRPRRRARDHALRLHGARRDKIGALVRMLEVENPESAIVFCNTKDETERVAEALAARGLRRRLAQRRSRRRSEREQVHDARRARASSASSSRPTSRRAASTSRTSRTSSTTTSRRTPSSTCTAPAARVARAARAPRSRSSRRRTSAASTCCASRTRSARSRSRSRREGELKTRAEADLVHDARRGVRRARARTRTTSRSRDGSSRTTQREAIVAGLLRDHLGARPTAQDEAAAARARRRRRGAPTLCPCPQRSPSLVRLRARSARSASLLGTNGRSRFVGTIASGARVGIATVGTIESVAASPPRDRRAWPRARPRPKSVAASPAPRPKSVAASPALRPTSVTAASPAPRATSARAVVVVDVDGVKAVPRCRGRRRALRPRRRRGQKPPRKGRPCR